MNFWLWAIGIFIYVGIALAIAIHLFETDKDKSRRSGFAALVAGFFWPFAFVAVPVLSLLKRADKT